VTSARLVEACAPLTLTLYVEEALKEYLADFDLDEEEDDGFRFLAQHRELVH